MIENVGAKQFYNSETKSRVFFLLFLATFLLAVFIRNVIGVGIPPIALLIAYAFGACFCDRDEIMALLVCCIPLNSAFQYKYAILILLFIYFLKYPSEVRITTLVVPFVCMIAWELLHGIKYDFSFVELFRSFAELFLLLFVAMLTRKRFNYSFIARVFAYCSVIVMTMAFIRVLKLNDYNFSGVFNGHYRFGVTDKSAEEFAFNFNANALGVICNLGFILLMQLRLIKKHKKVDYIAMFALVAFGAMTMSRSFLICFLISCLLMVFCGKTDSDSVLKKIIILVLGLVLLIGLVYLIFPSIIEQFVKRFQEEDISNGRIDLIGFYNNLIFNNAEISMFGVGLQNVFEKLKVITGLAENVSHNGVQEMILVWGLPGLLLFAWFIGMLIKTSRETNKKQSLINYLPFIFLFIKIQSGQFITYGAGLLSLLICYLSVCVNFNAENKDGEDI